MKQSNNFFEKGEIKSITDNYVTVHFFSSDDEENIEMEKLKPFFECPCGTIINGNVYISSRSVTDAENSGCRIVDANAKDYILQMKGFYKRICLS